MAIRNFVDRDTESFWKGVSIPRQYRAIARQAAKRLNILNEATSQDDLRNLASNHFETLHGNPPGRFSIRINQKSRVVFKWDDDGPFDVEIVMDYH